MEKRGASGRRGMASSSFHFSFQMISGSDDLEVAAGP